MMGYYGYGPMFDGWGGHGFGFGFGFVFMLVGLALLIALVVGLIRWFSGPAGHQRLHQDHELNRQVWRDEVLHILEKRYARGEIDEEEFKRRRQILKEEH